MKKTIYLSLIAVAIIISTILFFRSISRSHSPNIIGGIYLLRNISGKEFTFVSTSQKIMVIYYSPDCESCIYEATQIAKNRQRFSRFRLYFITDQLPERIMAFITKTNFPDYSKFFLYDHNSQFRALHNIRFYPTILVASETGRITRRIEGEMKIETLLSILNHGE